MCSFISKAGSKVLKSKFYYFLVWMEITGIKLDFRVCLKYRSTYLMNLGIVKIFHFGVFTFCRDPDVGWSCIVLFVYGNTNIKSLLKLELVRPEDESRCDWTFDLFFILFLNFESISQIAKPPSVHFKLKPINSSCCIDIWSIIAPSE